MGVERITDRRTKRTHFNERNLIWGIYSKGVKAAEPEGKKETLIRAQRSTTGKGQRSI